MNKKNFKSLFRCVFQMTGIFAVATALSFGVISCADDNIAQESGNNGDKDAKVSFNVLDVQQDAITRGGLIAETSSDLTSQRLEVRNNAGLDVCLIESTVEGVNPTQPNPATRANVLTAIDADFSTLGYRSDVSGFTTGESTQWFYNKTTTKTGELTEAIQWYYKQPHGRFYSVYPKVDGTNGITLSAETHDGIPYVNFEVQTDVKKQKDFMTACSGNIDYERHKTPRVNLAFRHALTAVKFAIGQNLSWGKTIDKVELRNVQYKGRYTLPNDSNVTGTWSDIDNARTTVSLSDLSVSTSDNPNTVIMGENNDNFVFYMLPQTLTGNNVKAYFHFTDNTEIEVTLTGSWKAGTTKTYKLSQNTSTWDYHLTVTLSASRNYSITSYRTAPDGTQQPVKWKVIGYEESVDGGNTWVDKGMTKPDWLTGLTAESGEGGTTAETGNATLKAAEVVDLLKLRNNALQRATQKGSASNYYNLANQTDGGATIQNTANCYLISAPGYYQIPLVYGNAIKNGTENKSSYHTENMGIYILQTFKDHADKEIEYPYINKQNEIDPATQASLVWADESGLVENLQVIGSGEKSFVRFRVPEDKIKNANAVIAVKNASGTVMWSWHLWFTDESALGTVECINYQYKKYYFTNEVLGWKYTVWNGTAYQRPRFIRVKIEQERGNVGNKEASIITIAQYPYRSNRQGNVTFYQFGRKDAFPGTDDIPLSGSFTKDAGNNMSIQNGIQNPDRFYTAGSSWSDVPPAGYSYINLWTMNNYSSGNSLSDNAVIKTIYDPCPVGFSIPSNGAFSGFSTTGKFGRWGTSRDREFLNLSENWDYYGHTFYRNRINMMYTGTIFFPRTNLRTENGVYIARSNEANSRYLTANLYSLSNTFTLIFDIQYGYHYYQIDRNNRFYGYAVRPVAEE